MAGGVTLQVRQIGSYTLAEAGPGDLLLMQPGGLGNPYASVDAASLVQTALQDYGPFSVGIPLPPSAAPAQIFTGNHVLQPQYGVGFNTYLTAGGNLNLGSGYCAAFDLDGPNGSFRWMLGAGQAGQPSTLVPQMYLSQAGALSLPGGTLTVARDPGAALEVATMGWVGNSTVASFNGRKGIVQLTSSDIYAALCLDSTIATQSWVCSTIQAATEMLLANHPFVFGWNGRTGAVYLTLADISCVFFQPGQQPITPTPPTTSDDYSIANTQWVTTYVTQTLAGQAGLATQAWVLANTVNSFNGRQGIVTLSLADITGAGGAPIVSPQFSGIPQAPTAAPGQATGQLATTLFVQQAVQSAVTGVVSFNNRTGAVELEATDINDVGGALLASPAFTGTATAPTAPTGTATTQLATCAFVLNEVQAIGAGVTTWNTRAGNVVLELADIEGAGGAPIASPAFSGTPTTPTPPNPVQPTLNVANTAWVVQYNALSTVSSFNGRIGAVTLSAADVSGAGGLANPNVALSGIPTAPTALPGTATTQIATTNFVMSAISNLGGNYVPLAGGVSISGPLTMVGAGATFTLSGNATANYQAVPLQQLNAALGGYLPLSGGVVQNPGVSTFQANMTAAITADGYTLAVANRNGLTLPGNFPTTANYDNVRSMVIAPNGTTVVNTNGLAAYVRNQTPSIGGFNNAVGVYCIVYAEANDAYVWGLNTVSTDNIPGGDGTPSTGTGKELLGYEVDFNVTSPNTRIVCGVGLAGDCITQPVGADGFVVSSLGNTPGQYKWTNGYITGDGSCINGAWLGAAQGSGNSVGSQPLVFNYFNPSGAAAQVSLSSDGSGVLTTSTSLLAGGSITGLNLYATTGLFPPGGSVITAQSGGWSWAAAAGGYFFGCNPPSNPIFAFGTTGTAYFEIMYGGDATLLGTLTQGSDATLKSNIAPLPPEAGLQAVMALQPKSFQWKNDDGDERADKATHWGFIAQDVEGVIDAAVGSMKHPDEHEILTLDHNAITASLVLAVQQLAARLAAVEAKA